MRRDFRRLGEGPFDLLVIGGGVYGSWTAYDAALRGLRVALVERRDWAAGTSSRSSKLIHGGLRYLEQRQLGLVRRSLAERRLLCELAPHRVDVLRLGLPVYRGDRVGPTRLRLGLWLYDRLAGADPRVGRRESLGRARVLERYPFLEPRDLRGGFTFGDGQTDDARFTLEIVDGALRSGAAAVNHAPVKSLLTRSGRVTGAVVEDAETGETIELGASLTVVCAGPWSPRLVGALGPKLPVRLTKGVHLVLPPLPTPDGLLLNSRQDRRVIFVLPWYGRTLLGTTDTDHTGDPAEARVEPDDVNYLLTEAGRVLADVKWTPRDVISSFAGLRTLRAGRNVPASALSREWTLEQPLEGLLVPVGGKYTSARQDAERIVDRALELLGREAVPGSTAELAFPWRPDGPFRSWSAERLIAGLELGLDEETALLCTRRHGSRIERIYETLRSRPELAQRIVPEAPFCLAETLLAVTEEMARTLEDVLVRRVPLMLLARPTAETMHDVARLIGQPLGWSEQRRRDEVGLLIQPPGNVRPTHARA